MFMGNPQNVVFYKNKEKNGPLKNNIQTFFTLPRLCIQLRRFAYL